MQPGDLQYRCVMHDAASQPCGRPGVSHGFVRYSGKPGRGHRHGHGHRSGRHV